MLFLPRGQYLDELGVLWKPCSFCNGRHLNPVPFPFGWNVVGDKRAAGLTAPCDSLNNHLLTHLHVTGKKEVQSPFIERMITLDMQMHQLSSVHAYAPRLYEEKIGTRSLIWLACRAIRETVQ